MVFIQIVGISLIMTLVIVGSVVLVAGVDCILECLKPHSKPLEEVAIVTYEEAIKYFVVERKKLSGIPEVKKAAISLKKYKQKYHVHYLFLNESNEIIVDHKTRRPYGREFIAKELDKELLDAFVDNELLIVT